MIFFLYGEDDFTSNEKLKQIIAKFKKEVDAAGLNIGYFDGENFNLEKFNSVSSQGGFLVRKRLLVIKNLLLNKTSSETIEAVQGILKKNSASENIFVFWERGNPDKRTILFKFLAQKEHHAQEFKPLNPFAVKQWIVKYAASQKAAINPSAAELLSASIGANLWQIKNELDKLIALAQDKAITSDNVSLLVKGKIDENIFNLAEAIAKGDKKKGLILLENQLAEGLNEIYLLTMIVRQFRIIMQIKGLMAEGKSESQIAREGKLHPFVVKKTLPLSKEFSLEKIKRAYSMLAEMDKKFKSTPLSQAALINLFASKI